jgi:hypothetical protein
MTEQYKNSGRIWSFRKRGDNKWYWEWMDMNGNVLTSAYFPDHVSCIENAIEFGWEGVVPKARLCEE